jgi:acyl-CoA synthetase (AMP-forming)/AMP-acid ligase II
MTIIGALAEVAARHSGHGLRVLNGDREAGRCTYDELYADAGRMASGLLTRGLTARQRVAIALPTSLDFARSFFGILAAGGVPVPLPPPLQLSPARTRTARIALILAQSNIRLVLSTGTLGALLTAELGGGNGGLTILDADDVREPSAVYADASEDDLGLIQYTSGTTSDPKGVLLSQANLLANTAAISHGLGATSADVCCSWLPMFHDMGLIGSLLCPVVNDAETCLLPPEQFLRDPGRWVRMISRYHGTIAAAPNSGYLHTLRKVPDSEVHRLDLSSWRLALNGSENVDPQTMRQFSHHFAGEGFAHNAFLPVYGLAEASLAVTLPPLCRKPKTQWVRRDLLGEGVAAFSSPGGELAREVASVGRPVTGTQVRLVDDNQVPVGANTRIGGIQVRGTSITRGYEANEDTTRQTFKADGWVATGDLGFWHEGELYIVGRTKEMIIINGQNYYASDIESLVSAVPGIPLYAVMAVSVPGSDGEELALFIETNATSEATRSDLTAQARYAVSTTLGISPREVFLVARGYLPRTSSGKLQRHHAQVRPRAVPGSPALDQAHEANTERNNA